MASLLLAVFVVLSLPSHSNEDFLKKAQKSMDLLDYEQAIHYYEQALSENPSKPEIRPRLGFCYFRTGKYENALQACSDELALFPKSLRARILRAYVFYHLGNSDEMAEACQDFNASLELHCKKRGRKSRKRV
jgi:tetratricopeptide (TPR) repeat protein